MKKTKTRRQLMNLLTKKYPNVFVKKGEEFGGGWGTKSLWTGFGESGHIDYWSERHDPEFIELLANAGWYHDWQDAGTVFLVQEG